MKAGERKFWLFLCVGDLLLINFSFFLGCYLKFDTLQLPQKYIFLLLILNMSWLMLASFFKLNDSERVSSIEKIVSSLCKAFSSHVLFIAFILFVIKANTFSREMLFYSLAISFLLILCWRIFANYLIKQYRKTGNNTQNVVIVGSGNRAVQLYHFFKENTAHGYNLLAVVCDNSVNLKLDCPLIELKELSDFCLENGVEEIYYTISYKDDKKTQDLMSFSDSNMIRLRIIPDFKSFKSRRVNINFYGEIPIITLRDEPLQDDFNRLIKRVFDIVFSLLVIICLFSWLFPLIILVIKISDNGPVFFTQLRSGLDNIHFHCYKFRTMRYDERSDSKQAEVNDKRVTKIGEFLRKHSLDEFPQFLNVLKGEMSIVGPRPHMIQHTDQYSKLISNYMVRQLVKPGITGSAQVNGFRGETKLLDKMKGRVNYDVWYIENWSLLLDVKLIFKTIFNLFKGDINAY